MFTDVDNPNIYSWFRSGSGAPFIKIIIKREVHKMDKKLRELTKEARAAQDADENKMNELKAISAATRDARSIAFTTYSAACRATDSAWDAYILACEDARKAADASNVYEARTYGA